MKVPILLGTSRKENKSSLVFDIVHEEARKIGFETELIRPEDYLTTPVTGRIGQELEEQTQWQKVMSEADGLIVVTPEYNHGYPGELKLMIDQLYVEYNNKPVLIVGVSNGTMGGARAVEQLIPVFVCVGMRPQKRGVYTNVDEDIDETGTPNEAYLETLQNALKRFSEVFTT